MKYIQRRVNRTLVSAGTPELYKHATFLQWGKTKTKRGPPGLSGSLPLSC